MFTSFQLVRVNLRKRLIWSVGGRPQVKASAILRLLLCRFRTRPAKISAGRVSRRIQEANFATAEKTPRTSSVCWSFFSHTFLTPSHQRQFYLIVPRGFAIACGPTKQTLPAAATGGVAVLKEEEAALTQPHHPTSSLGDFTPALGPVLSSYLAARRSSHNRCNAVPGWWYRFDRLARLREI